MERLASGQHLEQHATEREDVAAVIGRKPFACSGDMYAAVPRITPACVAIMLSVGEFATFCAAAVGLDRLGQAEVEHLDLAVRRDLQLAGFRSRWTMPFSCAASSASAICTRDRQRLVERQRPAQQAIGQRLALDQLHDQEMSAVGLLEAVERGDVRVIQRRQDLRFALEPRHAVGVGREDVEETLIATSRLSRVSRARYTSPMPPAPRTRDLVGAEAGAGSNGHGGGIIRARAAATLSDLEQHAGRLAAGRARHRVDVLLRVSQ